MIDLNNIVLDDFGLVTVRPSPFSDFLMNFFVNQLNERLALANLDPVTAFLLNMHTAAEHAVAAGDGWPALKDGLMAAADQLEVPAPPDLNSFFDAALEEAQQRPTPWIVIARSYVFGSDNNQFIHIASGAPLSPEAFDLEFGCLCPEPAVRFSRFLCDDQYVVRVHSVVHKSEQAAFYLDDGCLYLSIPTRTSYIESAPVLFHLNS